MTIIPEPESVRILQISDTHFTKKLATRGSRWGSRAIGTPSHDFARITALQAALARLGPDAYDHLVVTGDVSTDGSRAALELARTYIEDDSIQDPISKRLVLYGLNSRGKCTVLPGNHDRYRGSLALQRRSRRFESVFEDRSYPYVKTLPPPRAGAPSIAFFVFDSTQTLRLQERVFSADTLPARVARGEVSSAECQFLVRESKDLSKQEPEVMVKIALLHHHPLPPPASDRLARLKSMDNSKEFVAACLEAGINLVLFGHQHIAFERTVTDGPKRRTHFLCCPSTFEYTVKEPGFYLHNIFATHASVAHYQWQGAGFASSPQQYTFKF